MRSSIGAAARRRQLRRWAAIAPVVAILGMLLSANAAGADGKIVLVGGQYYSGCLDTANSPAAAPSGPATTAKFGYRTRGIAVSTLGDRLLIADYGGNRLDEVALNASPPTIKALVTGVAPTGVAVDPRNSATVYFVDGSAGHLFLRRVDTGSGQVTPVADLGPAAGGDFVADSSTALAVDGRGNVYVAIQGTEENAGVHVVSAGTSTPTKISTSPVAHPFALAVAGTSLFVTELGQFGTASGQLVRLDNPGSGVPAATVRSGLRYPSGVAVDPTGRVFVAEGGNQTVTELDLATLQDLQPVAGTARTPGSSGDGELGTNATLQNTLRLAADAQHNVLILDGDNCVVRMVKEMPKKAEVSDTTSPTIPPTTAATDTTLPRPTDPTIPGNQVRDVPETQILPETQVQPQAQADPGPAANATGARTDALLGNQFANQAPAARFGGALGSNVAGNTGASTAPGGVGVNPGAAGTGALAQPAPPLPPPAPAPAPGYYAPAAAPGAGPPVPAGVGADSPSPRGVPRYAMVAHDRAAGVGLRPVAAAAACGIIGLFGSCLIAALGTSKGTRAPRRTAVRARPRRAY